MLHHEDLQLTHKLLTNPMTKLYIFQSILTFVKSLIGIFAPVYLFSQGFSLEQIIFYVIGSSLTYLLTIPHTIKIVNKIGFKYTIFLSTPIYLLHITTLNYITLTPSMLHLSWFTFGLHIGLFWPCMHLEMAHNSDKKKPHLKSEHYTS